MLILTQQELVELTGKERPSAQVRALTHMGIPYRTRPDGTPVVLRVILEMIEQASMGSNGKLRAPQPEPQLQP